MNKATLAIVASHPHHTTILFYKPEFLIRICNCCGQPSRFSLEIPSQRLLSSITFDDCMISLYGVSDIQPLHCFKLIPCEMLWIHPLNHWRVGLVSNEWRPLANWVSANSGVSLKIA